MGAKQDGEKLLGQLPGTGGDFVDTNDTEGHRAKMDPPEVAKRNPEDVAKRDPENDVEGHRLPDGEEDLYRGGPTTQGEIVMRGPGDNPHGDR
jgi:hypothetical protein